MHNSDRVVSTTSPSLHPQRLMIQVPLEIALKVEETALRAFEKEKAQLTIIPRDTLITKRAELLAWFSVRPPAELSASFQPERIDKPLLQRLVDLSIIQPLLNETPALR